MKYDGINKMKISNLLKGYKNNSTKILFKYFQKKFLNSNTNINFQDEVSYPFVIHKNSDFFDDYSGFKKLYLVGKNWIETEEEQKFALMFSFAQWKYGFVADYLPEYKTAFVHSTSLKIKFPFLVRRIHKQKPIDVLVVWGSGVSFWVSIIAKIYKIPIYHMEDGFIRSAMPGTTKNLPHSLVLDKSGLYYNSQKNSDIENILNNYDFYADNALLEQARSCLEFYKDLKMSKYNPPIMDNGDEIVLKKRKRVAIIGQVKKDMSLRYGNPDKWTMASLVSLATRENPDADIFYRIHPDEYNQNVNLKGIASYANVVSPDGSISDFLNSMDHIYVINSLTGLEALILNKKVTVVGHAFYAGWGLTDDRCQMQRRTRKLTLLELFAGTYLKYPRYLSNLTNNRIGFISSCYSIKADQYIAAQQQYTEVRKKIQTYHKKIKNFDLYNIITNIQTLLDKDFKNYTDMNTLKNNLSIIFKSNFWPIVFKEPLKDSSVAQEKFLVSQLPFNTIFRNRASGEGQIFQLAFLHLIFNALCNPQSRDFFIESVREFINPNVLNMFIVETYNVFEYKYLLDHLKWVYSETNLRNSEVIKEINGLIVSNMSLYHKEQDESDMQVGIKEQLQYMDSKDILDIMDMFLKNYDYKELYHYISRFFLVNVIKAPEKEIGTIIFLKLSIIALKKGDLFSARQLSHIINAFNMGGHNHHAQHVLTENGYDLVECSDHELALQYALQLKTAPQRLNRSWAILKKSFSKTSDSYQIFASIASLYSKLDLKKVNYLIEIDQPQEALLVLDYMTEHKDFSDPVYVAYSKALSLIGQFEEAKNIIEKAITKLITHQNIVEYIRLLRIEGDFEKALEIAQLGQKAHVNITDEAQMMPINFGLKRIEEGFKCFLDTPLKKILIQSFGEDKYKLGHGLDDCDDLLLIFSSGPAEEIRFASIYAELRSAIGHDNFKITCDHRLYTLLARSFENINFLPVKRSRFFCKDYPATFYNQLPTTELCNALDNDSLPEIHKAKKIKLLTEYLYKFRKEYNDFSGQTPYLKTDPKQVLEFSNRLPNEKMLIGICWRSFLTNALRNVHYLSVQDLEQIFRLENVQFVNLQYDECSSELEYIRDQYGCDIIDFDDLDQMNDFDGVAALMQNLDLIISPCTAVIELAGAVGTQSLLFSNHGDINWRKIDTHGTDIWYHNVQIVGEGIGDKKALAGALLNAVNERITTFKSSKNKHALHA